VSPDGFPLEPPLGGLLVGNLGQDGARTVHLPLAFRDARLINHVRRDVLSVAALSGFGDALLVVHKDRVRQHRALNARVASSVS